MANQTLHLTGAALLVSHDTTLLQRPWQVSIRVRVRHEGVAETVLLFTKEVTTPAVRPAVSYRGVRPWQRGGAKPSGQRTLIRKGGSRGASRCCDCQHRGGWGPAGRGMVNPGEPLQASSPRTSQRCCQAWTKRYVARSGCSELIRRRCRATGVEAGPNPRGLGEARW